MFLYLKSKQPKMMVSGTGFRRFMNLLSALGNAVDDSGVEKLAKEEISSRNNNRKSVGAMGSFDPSRIFNRENAPNLPLAAANGRIVNQNSMHLLESYTVKLEKLKNLLLVQATALRKQQSELEEKKYEIERLKAEIDMLKKDAQQTNRRTHERLRSRIKNVRPRNPLYSITTRNRSCITGKQSPSKVHLEIIRLSPTSSKIRRVRQNSSAYNVANESTKFVPQNVHHSTVSNTNSTNYASSFRPSCPAALRTQSSEISVPSWRVTHFSASVTLEGTEDITDDAYLKRHHKFYVEEKRVIRRDRLREKELENYRKRSSVVSYLTPTTTPQAQQVVKTESPSIPQIDAIAIVDKVSRGSLVEDSCAVPGSRRCSIEDSMATPKKRRRHQ